MKKVIKFFMAALLVGMCSLGYAQTNEWQKPPKSTEVEIGVVNDKLHGGNALFNKDSKWRHLDVDDRDNLSFEYLYERLLKKAQNEYGDRYPRLALRNFKATCDNKIIESNEDYVQYERYYYYSATIVIDPKAEADRALSSSLDKALRNVREGSRLAIDQVSVRTGINREEYKDQLIDILLERGYKVVAKDYLEKLYEELQAQQSGIYNDKTTVKENNFSAVGYYINVKVTETSVRVQVVNVSTGEFEGNATVEF